MHLRIVCTILFLGLAISGAIPSPEKEDTSNDNNLHLEDVGEDRERSKKSVFFAAAPLLAPAQAVNLLPQAQTVSIQTTAPAVQTLSIQPALETVQTLNIQPALDTVQTVSFQSAAPGMQAVSIQPAVETVQGYSIQSVIDALQTLNIQSAAPLQIFSIQPLCQTIPALSIQATGQPIQAVSFQPSVQTAPVTIQTAGQPYQTVNLIPPQSSLLPQSAVITEQVQPLSTVDIVQPAAGVEIIQPARSLDIVQPVYSQANLNFVQSSPAVEQVRVLSGPRPVVETITQEEVIQSVRRPANVVVANEEIVNVAGPVTTVYKEQLPLYNEQVVVGPSKSFTLFSEPDMVASYVNGPQMQYSYQPVASSGVVVDEPYHYLGLRDHALVDTAVQKTNLLDGREVETVRSKVYESY